MSIEKSLFGTLADGRSADVYTLRNASGMSVKITNFGGTILQINVPDKDGRFSNVNVGYDSLKDYATAGGALGTIVGRFANRIGKAKFVLDGREYQLCKNRGENHLHGGKEGFALKVWTVVEADDSDEPSLVLNYISEDGEENYPGRLDVTVTYSLSADNALSIVYRATTDKPTILNLTNHAYFNLRGYASGEIFDHIVWIDAESYLAITNEQIPTGEIIAVDGTPFDFRTPKTIGKDFYADDAALKVTGGYDHCFNFTGWRDIKGDEAPLRATVIDPVSGRRMDMYTNQPCVQFYTANFLKGSAPLAGGLPQKPQTAYCLETQFMPDSVNHENFTNAILRPGEEYNHVTAYKFSVEK